MELRQWYEGLPVEDVVIIKDLLEIFAELKGEPQIAENYLYYSLRGVIVDNEYESGAVRDPETGKNYAVIIDHTDLEAFKTTVEFDREINCIRITAANPALIPIL